MTPADIRRTKTGNAVEEAAFAGSAPEGWREMRFPYIARGQSSPDVGFDRWPGIGLCLFVARADQRTAWRSEVGPSPDGYGTRDYGYHRLVADRVFQVPDEFVAACEAEGKEKR